MNERMKSIAAVCGVAWLAWAGIALGQGTNTATRPITLRECIERALANNLEVRFERLNPTIAQWGVRLREGVFDPTLSAGIVYEHSSTRAAGEAYSWTPSVGLSGVLPSGTEYQLTARDETLGGTAITNFLYTGDLALSVTQPLVRDFWFEPLTANIRIARRNLNIASYNFARLVMTKVTQVGTAYYELLFAIENHKAKLEDLVRARRLLDENRKRVEVGVMSPLDVTQAEAGVAEREEAVIVAERTIADQENALKRLIATEVREFEGLTLVPTDLPVVEMVELDATRSTKVALSERPDFMALKEASARSEILVRSSRNDLLPRVDLQASGSLGGDDTRGFGGLTQSQLRGDNPAWSVGLVVSLPLGNRQARASYNIARLDAQQSALALQQLEQDIVVEVDNVVGQVRTNLKRVEVTRVASRLAEESLKAEEAKLRAGTSTSFLVLQAQTQLVNARTAEIRARADYSQSLINLARAEGRTLAKYGIQLDLGKR